MISSKCNCDRCQHEVCARRVPIFSTLSIEELQKVVNLIYRRSYIKGELIVIEGSNLDSLIIINSGQVKAYRDTQDGKEQILYVFSEGDFFGEKNLIINQAATYNVEALEETNICAIRKEDFQKLLTEHPSIGLKIMEELCNRLDRLEKTIEGMGSKDVEARLGMVLLEFARKHGKESGEGILVELPLSREGIASYIGLTRETVSRKMTLLQNQGIIEMVGNKKVLIKNIKLLEQTVQ